MVIHSGLPVFISSMDFGFLRTLMPCEKLMADIFLINIFLVCKISTEKFVSGVFSISIKFKCAVILGLSSNFTLSHYPIIKSGE